MGFLDRFNAIQQADILKQWEVLDESVALAQLVEISHQKPVVIFKHSIRCGISSMVKNQLESDWDFSEGELEFYYLDLINHRAVSNAIADELGVIHQSPQIIVLKDGKAVYDTSHHMVSTRAIRQAI
ncbi:MAG: bacillithiol system redox-active protein YtxJ [Bacteroidota bacterium]